MINYNGKIIASEDDNIQHLAMTIGKLETKAIGKLVDEMGLPKILDKYLSVKERDIYHRSKFKLKQLVNK